MTTPPTASTPRAPSITAPPRSARSRRILCVPAGRSRRARSAIPHAPYARKHVATARRRGHAGGRTATASVPATRPPAASSARRPSDAARARAANNAGSVSSVTRVSTIPRQRSGADENNDAPCGSRWDPVPRASRTFQVRTTSRRAGGLTNILVISKLWPMQAPGIPSVLAAVASPRRREILRLLWNEEQTAGAIHRAMPDVTFGAVSLQLRSLTEAGLVGSRAVGRHRFYRARRDALGPVANMLEQMWDDALWRLKLAAELEQTRRGPRPRRRSRKG